VSLTDEALEKLTNDLLGKFVDEIENITPQTVKSGSRGRVAFIPGSLAEQVGKVLAGARGHSLSPFLMPNNLDNQEALKLSAKILGEKTEDLCKAMEGPESITKHGVSPTPTLNLGEGLSTVFKRFAEAPQELFIVACSDLAKSGTPEQKTLLDALVNELKNAEVVEEVKTIIAGIEVTFNDATHQKMPLGDFTNHTSVAAIMYNLNLPIQCSISGTTVDIVLGALLSMKPEDMVKVLEPLHNYVQHYLSSPPEPPLTQLKDGKQFQEFLTGISVFMQSGQYHTAAEVLGGLFIAMRGLTTEEAKNIDIKETYVLFSRLMKDFADHPERFFGVKEEDAKKMDQAISTMTQKFIEVAQDRARENLTNQPVCV